MRWIILSLALLLLLLQYALWFGDGGLMSHRELDKRIEAQRQINRELEERNAAIAEEVEALRSSQGLEERARRDLGLIGEGETFFMLVDPDGSGEDMDQSE